MACEGSSIQESQLVSGVLLEAPEYPTFMNNHVFKAEQIKVALYNVSMAGDTQEWFEGVTTETAPGLFAVNIAGGVLKQMLLVADELTACGVKLVACQKCMHPALKTHLRERASASDVVKLFHALDHFNNDIIHRKALWKLFMTLS